MAKRTALVVGLGISGIACAIALHRAGWTPVIVERAPARRLFSGAMHPYTWSLMTAALSPEREKGSLAFRPLLKGDPPNPLNPPPGCRFAGRCQFASEECHTEKPALREMADGHSVACHHAGKLVPPIAELARAA